MNPTNGTAGMQQPVARPTAAVVPAPNAIINAQQHSQDTAKCPTRKVFPFRKAVKHDAKLRLALAGPGGSGKTYTLLKLATELGGRIAVVDTEHGSASKYADEFDFDVRGSERGENGNAQRRRRGKIGEKIVRYSRIKIGVAF